MTTPLHSTAEITNTSIVNDRHSRAGDGPQKLSQILEHALPPQPRLLVKKLATIRQQVQSIQKQQGDQVSHTVVRNEDVLATIGPKLAENHITIFPHLRSISRDESHVHVEVDFTIEDGESGETRLVCYPGSAPLTDTLPTASAMTLANKQMLLNVFQLPASDPSRPTNGATAAAQRKGSTSPQRNPQQEKSVQKSDVIGVVQKIIDSSKSVKVKLESGAMYVASNHDLMDRLRSVKGRKVKLTVANGNVVDLVEIYAD